MIPHFNSPEAKAMREAQAEDVRRALSRIVAQRPELDLKELEAQVMKLAKNPEQSARAWAAHCMLRVLSGQPLPWEQDATDVGAKS